ncbi:MAG: cyclic nucleotide-binding domain-containing protein, partial [Burkholderiales bacterium]|nr:cyclic nucleotide-binding domain-containing protein [Burkholderiales bacterium]
HHPVTSTVPANPPKLTRAGVQGDVLGGFAAALIALPQALGKGALVFLPLGLEYVHVGLIAGLYAAIVGCIVAALLGRLRYQISEPITSAAVICASLVATLAANPLFSSPTGLKVGNIAALVFLAIFMGGVLQVLFAWLKLGRALKFIPQPVLAGFMYGVAIQIFIQQVRPLFGLPPDLPFSELFSYAGKYQPWAIAVGAVTIVAVLIARRVSDRVSAPMIALLAGTIAFVLLRSVAGADEMGEVLRAPPTGALFNSPVPAMLQLEWTALWPGVMTDVAITALLLAIIGSVTTLLSAAMVDAATGSNQNGDRALLTQGVGNMCSATAGGLFTGGSTLAVLANFEAGGRTALSGATLVVIFVCLLFAGGALVAYIPLVVLAGIMIAIAIGIVDSLSKDMVLKVRGKFTFDSVRAANFSIIVLVGATTAFFNIVAAVVIGVLAATILLVVRMSTSIVYRLSDGVSRSSLKGRGAEQALFLREQGAQIGIVELSGYVFFGTADRMRTEIEAFARGRKAVILDFRRVYEVEASGARVLQVLGKTLAGNGVAVALSHVRVDEPLGHYLQDSGASRSIAPERWFTDLDRALEWAEDDLLMGGGKLAQASDEIPLANAELFADLAADELAALQALLVREELANGSLVFREGDAGDRLFVITRGEVSIKLKLPGTVHLQRLASFGPGMVFGEMALIEGKPRSADAHVMQDAVVYALDAANFGELRKVHPAIAFKIMGSLTRQLAGRLRTTSEQLRNSY